METLKVQLVGSSVIITFILCYFFAYLKGETRKQRFAQKAKTAGYVTEGTCVHTRTLRGYDAGEVLNRDTTRVLTYVYQVDGVKYKKKLSYYSPHDDDPLPPDTIKIYYNPRNPKKSVGAPEASRGSQLQSGCLFSMFFPLFVGWVVNFLIGLFV